MLSEAQASAKEAKYQLDQVETENSKLRQQLSSSNKDLDERLESTQDQNASKRRLGQTSRRNQPRSPNRRRTKSVSRTSSTELVELERRFGSTQSTAMANDRRRGKIEKSGSITVTCTSVKVEGSYRVSFIVQFRDVEIRV
jgi:hypothetical protein